MTHTDPRHPLTRRQAIITTTLAGVAGMAALRAGAPAFGSIAARPEPLFRISLAQWSLHRALFAGELDHLDFPKAAKNDYGIDAVEYVNAFFKKKGDASYVKELKQRCDDLGVKSILIMCDGEGALGDADEAKRLQAVENHRKWIEAAKTLGCHCIRVNAQSAGTPTEQADRAADGLHRLCVLADPYDIDVIVENHGGLSSHGDWLAGVMKKTAHKRIGTLPDFGNFYEYDRYQGVTDMMPFAKGVSAKSYAFDEAGNETKVDFRRMLKIVMDAGYHGRIGIEFEGDKIPEPEGIKLTKKLLEKIRAEMTAAAPAPAPKGS